MLTHGQRVCAQHSDASGRFLPANIHDRGTFVAEEKEGWFTVVWDTGEADHCTITGWVQDHRFRVLPLGTIPDVQGNPW